MGFSYYGDIKAIKISCAIYATRPGGGWIWILQLATKEVGLEVEFERADADMETDRELCIQTFLGHS